MIYKVDEHFDRYPIWFQHNHNTMYVLPRATMWANPDYATRGETEI